MTNFILSIVGSLIAVAIVAFLRWFRRKQLEYTVRELKEEEDLVVRLNKGNTRLIRLSFFMMFVFLTILLVIFSLFFFILAFNLLPMKTLYICVAYLLFSLSIGGFYIAKVIVKSANVAEAKKGYKEKRQKIEQKLKT